MQASGTKVQQQTAVGQGLALGAIMQSISELNGNKVTLELDLRRAWRDWQYANLYPAVRAGFDRDDVFHILYDSARRRHAYVACWEGSWPFLPTLRVDSWTADEVAEIIDDRVPAIAWKELVHSWLVASPGRSRSAPE